MREQFSYTGEFVARAYYKESLVLTQVINLREYRYSNLIYSYLDLQQIRKPSDPQAHDGPLQGL